ALAGRRVALVDLDMRDPGIDRVFALGKTPGLAQVVLGDMPLADAMIRIPLARGEEIGPAGRLPLTAGTLDIIPSGSLPPNPGEFVASHAVAKILATVREEFDVVLVDAPPLLAVSDGITLGGQVDAVVVVVRLNVTDHEMLHELTRGLNACPCDK